MKDRIIYLFLRIAKLVALFTPLLIVFNKNFDKYFPNIKESTETKINLTIGGIILLVVIACTIIGELSQKGDGTKVRNPIMTTLKLGALYGIIHCFKPIVVDIELIVGSALVGQASSVLIEYASRVMYERMKVTSQAIATTKAMARVEKKKVATPYE